MELNNLIEKSLQEEPISFDIDNAISPLKDRLKSHKVYDALKSIKDVKYFMEYHVYAVWDFMSIVKSLQIELTNVSIPWIPNRKPNIARMINEVVHGEESDIDDEGNPKSHFEIYLDAMSQLGCNRNYIDYLIKSIDEVNDLENIFKRIPIDKRVKDFTRYTFDIINSEKVHCVASIFTYGREDLIPDIFIEILNELDSDNSYYNKLRYYLSRHIEVDGDVHGPIAKKMVQELCGTNRKLWVESTKVAKQCLEHRIKLWDAIYDLIISKKVPKQKIESY